MDAPSPALGMTRLSEAEDLGVGEDPEAELGNIKAFGERHPSDDQGAASRDVSNRVASGGGDLTLGQQLGEASGLRSRDERGRLRRPRRGDVLDELGEPTGVARRAGPPQAQRVSGGPHACDAVPRREVVDPRARDVRRREHADREAELCELVAPLLGLRLERIVCELELDGVLEDHARAIAEMVEQRSGCAKSGCERVSAGRVASFAELVDELGIWSKGIGGLGGGAPQLVPAGSREPLGELRCVLQRELARRKDVEMCQVRLRALRDRIEGAERLDLVAEELDARRLLR